MAVSVISSLMGVGLQCCGISWSNSLFLLFTKVQLNLTKTLKLSGIEKFSDGSHQRHNIIPPSFFKQDYNKQETKHVAINFIEKPN